MLKKLFFTAAAAAAVSVPLAGVAWADKPSDPGANGKGLGQGGVPAAAGDYLQRTYPDANPPFPDKVTPGSVFSQAAQLPGLNTPEGYGVALTQQFNTLGLPDVFPSGSLPAVPPPSGTTFTVGPTVPGSVVKLFTPGCDNGKSPRPTVTISVNGTVSGTETAGCVS
jgi:hypothetical protein